MVYNKKKNLSGDYFKGYLKAGVVKDYNSIPLTEETIVVIFLCKNGSVMCHEIAKENFEIIISDSLKTKKDEVENGKR